MLEHGPYAGQLTVSALTAALRIDGIRGLQGVSSIAERNKIISDREGLDYQNHMDKPHLDMTLIDESLLAHRLTTGEWLSIYKNAPGGKPGSYVLEHGPYAGHITVSALDHALTTPGARGLSGKFSIAARNQIISDKEGLDYVKKGQPKAPGLDS